MKPRFQRDKWTSILLVASFTLLRCKNTQNSLELLHAVNSISPNGNSRYALQVAHFIFKSTFCKFHKYLLSLLLKKLFKIITKYLMSEVLSPSNWSLLKDFDVFLSWVSGVLKWAIICSSIFYSLYWTLTEKSDKYFCFSDVYLSLAMC